MLSEAPTLTSKNLVLTEHQPCSHFSLPRNESGLENWKKIRTHICLGSLQEIILFFLENTVSMTPLFYFDS